MTPGRESGQWRRSSPFKFLQEARAQAQKVTWPTRKETTVTTIMVFVMVTIAVDILPAGGSSHAYRRELPAGHQLLSVSIHDFQ